MEIKSNDDKSQRSKKHFEEKKTDINNYDDLNLKVISLSRGYLKKIQF